MASPSVSVGFVRPGALQLGADEPCVLEIHIPITLTHHLNPSLPAPPYHAGTIQPYEFRNGHAITVFQLLIAQIITHMLGPSSWGLDYVNGISNLELEVHTNSNDPFLVRQLES